MSLCDGRLVDSTGLIWGSMFCLKDMGLGQLYESGKACLRGLIHSCLLYIPIVYLYIYMISLLISPTPHASDIIGTREMCLKPVSLLSTTHRPYGRLIFDAWPYVMVMVMMVCVCSVYLWMSKHVAILFKAITKYFGNAVLLAGCFGSQVFADACLLVLGHYQTADGLFKMLRTIERTKIKFCR